MPASPASTSSLSPIERTRQEPFLSTRPCPNCGSVQTRITVRAACPAENLTWEEIGKAWREFFRETCFFSYFRCTACQQLYAPLYLSADALRTLYSQMGDNIHSGDERLSRLTQREYCSMAARYLPQARSYCEIGPDIGLFLEETRRHYPIEKAVLIEPNRNVWARLEQAASGIKSDIAPTAEAIAAIADGSVDLIVAIHVLDHLLIPSDTIQWVKRKLSPKGVAVFVVHDERSTLTKILGRRWPPYCLQHPQLYNAATFRNTLSSMGLCVKDVLRTSNYFPLGYLIEHALYSATRKHYGLDWLKWPVRLKLGNIMAIATLTD